MDELAKSLAKCFDILRWTFILLLTSCIVGVLSYAAWSAIKPIPPRQNSLSETNLRLLMAITVEGLRKQYPQYNDLSNEELAEKICIAIADKISGNPYLCLYTSSNKK